MRLTPRRNPYSPANMPHALVREAARRWLAGETTDAIAYDIGTSGSTLRKLLRQLLGVTRYMELSAEAKKRSLRRHRLNGNNGVHLELDEVEARKREIAQEYLPEPPAPPAPPRRVLHPLVAEAVAAMLGGRTITTR